MTERSGRERQRSKCTLYLLVVAAHSLRPRPQTAQFRGEVQKSRCFPSFMSRSRNLIHICEGILTVFAEAV